jgi:hypothetical protein
MGPSFHAGVTPPPSFRYATQRASEHPVAATDAADQVSAAIRAELEPVLARLERLEGSSAS